MATYDSIISRTDAAATIPEEQVREVVKVAEQESLALSLFRRINMGSKTAKLPVLSAAPTAYFVAGDSGLKQTTESAWQGVVLTAEEIACSIPIPTSVIDDSGIDLWAELRPALAEAVGRVLDLAVFLGTDKPASWPTAIIPAAVAAGNTTARGATAAQGGVAQDLNALLGLVEKDGHDPSALALSRGLRRRCARHATPPGRSSWTSRPATTRAYRSRGLAPGCSAPPRRSRATSRRWASSGCARTCGSRSRTAPWCRTTPARSCSTPGSRTA